MLIPEKIPGAKWVLFLWAVTAVTWVILEGNLWLTVCFAVLTAVVIVLALLKKHLAGRNLSLLKWLMVSAFLGLFVGLGSAILTLTFMAIKTGLHAHGPEFSSLEINWIIRQMPVWAISGLIAGVGLGLLFKSLSRS